MMTTTPTLINALTDDQIVDLRAAVRAEGYDACVFSQDGRFVAVGHREECEQTAKSMGALYCWIYRGRVIVRKNFVADWDMRSRNFRKRSRYAELVRANTQGNTITIENLVNTTKFVSELVRQGVMFTVQSEDITEDVAMFNDGQMRVVSIAWHVTLTGGF